MTTPLIDPVTGQEFARAPLSGPEDVDAAMQAAERAFETWREATPSERSRALLRIADALEDHADDFARLEVENTGKPYRATLDGEFPPPHDQLRFFAGAARMLGRAGHCRVHGGPHLIDPA